MAGDPQAELSAALVAAQLSVPQLHRDGKGDKGAYTTADHITSLARKHLNEHGLAWSRTSATVEAGKLMHSMEDPESAEGTGADIGYRCYAGDLVTTWELRHIGGGVLTGRSTMPVITGKGTPHDKAVAASATFLTGQTIRGILCWDRESKDAVDKRVEEERGQRGKQQRQTERRDPPRQSAAAPRTPKAPDIGPRCSGQKGGPLANSNARRRDALAKHDKANPMHVWAWALKEAKIDLGKYAGLGYAPEQLTIDDGTRVRAVLKQAEGAKGIDDVESDELAKGAP